ncbi:hypothetical protein HJ581_0008230 [Rhodococcus opacus]|nr:hypothetical protein HJ581_0008230 [Rhodococcus opacus]
MDPNLMLTEHQAAAEDVILTEVHGVLDNAGIDGEDHPSLALDLLGAILHALIKSGHIAQFPVGTDA